MCVGRDNGPDGGIRAWTQRRGGRVVATWRQRRPTKYRWTHGSHVRLQWEKPGNHLTTCYSFVTIKKSCVTNLKLGHA